MITVNGEVLEAFGEFCIKRGFNKEATPPKAVWEVVRLRRPGEVPIMVYKTTQTDEFRIVGDEATLDAFEHFWKAEGDKWRARKLYGKSSE